MQPLWIMAWSTIVEYSQQEGFYRVPLPAARQTPPTWRTSDLNVSTPATKCPSFLKRRERTPASEDGTTGEKLLRILPKVANSTSLLGSFTCRKFTTWDRRLYFPSEGRRVEDFFRPKNPTASAGFELGYQRPARSPLDHRSRFLNTRNRFEKLIEMFLYIWHSLR